MTVAYSYWGMVAEGNGKFTFPPYYWRFINCTNLNITSLLTARLRFFPCAVLSVI